MDPLIFCYIFLAVFGFFCPLVALRTHYVCRTRRNLNGTKTVAYVVCHCLELFCCGFIILLAVLNLILLTITSAHPSFNICLLVCCCNLISWLATASATGFSHLKARCIQSGPRSGCTESAAEEGLGAEDTTTEVIITEEKKGTEEYRA